MADRFPYLFITPDHRIALSVQASAQHYCLPKTDYSYLCCYKEVEVAVVCLDAAGRFRKFVKPSKMKKYLPEKIHPYISPTSPVIANVPLLVIFDFLSSLRRGWMYYLVR